MQNQDASLPTPRSWRCWLLAIRPKTLFAAISPVLLGSALAYSEDKFHFLSAIAALLGAICIQIGTNLANDYWDARKGTDTKERLGPVRVTAAGLLPAKQVLIATWLSFAVASCFGCYLIWQAGWPVVVIGILSIACGLLYTATRYSLAYLGLGDLFSFAFFGIVATAGTYFVQAKEFSYQSCILGAIPGFYSVALLAVNNLRDRHGDELSNKRTLAVRFGDRFARGEVIVCLLLPGVIPWCGWDFPWMWTVGMSGIAVVFAKPIILAILRGCEGRSLNLYLGRTSLVNLFFSLLFAFFLIKK